MSRNMISDNPVDIDRLANCCEDPANICDPSIVVKEKIEERIIREINKPIYEFVGAIDNKGNFVRYTRLIRRDQ